MTVTDSRTSGRSVPASKISIQLWTFNRYIEPFLGSGAVFFDLYAAGRLEGRRVRLSDVNPDLIGCYRVVRDDADAC